MPVPLSEYGGGLPASESVGNSLFSDNCLCRMCAVGRVGLLPGFHFDPFPVCVSCRIRCRMKFGALPLSGRMIRLTAPRAMPPIFPGGGAATVSVFVDGVFLERLTGLFAYGISGKSRSLLCFPVRISCGEAVTCCSKALFSLIFSPEIWSFTNFDLLLRSFFRKKAEARRGG